MVFVCSLTLYLLYLYPGKPVTKHPTALDSDKQTKISEFLQDMQELGMGEPAHLPQPPITNGPSMPPDSSRSGTSPEDKARVGDSVAGRSEAGGEAEEGCGLSAVEKRLVSEWVPLGLNFGIPLFDEGANKIVCEKVNWHSCLESCSHYCPVLHYSRLCVTSCCLQRTSTSRHKPTGSWLWTCSTSSANTRSVSLPPNRAP